MPVATSLNVEALEDTVLVKSKVWVLSAGTSNEPVPVFNSVVWVEPSYILSDTFTVIVRCAGLVAVTCVVNSTSPAAVRALRSSSA